jgi:hypothetical protein
MVMAAVMAAVMVVTMMPMSSLGFRRLGRRYVGGLRTELAVGDRPRIWRLSQS